MRTGPTGSAGSGTRPASELMMSVSGMQPGRQRPRLAGAAEQQDPHQCRLPRVRPDEYR